VLQSAVVALQLAELGWAPQPVVALQPLHAEHWQPAEHRSNSSLLSGQKIAVPAQAALGSQ